MSESLGTLNGMEQKLTYASIAIVDLSLEKEIAIEVLSVSEDSCDLSGAWLISFEETKKLNEIVADKPLIFIGENDSVSNSIVEKSATLDMTDFLAQARRDARTALESFSAYVVKNVQEYETYMAMPPAERKILPKIVKKSLISPKFSNWPDAISLDKAESELERMGKLSKIDGTPSEMRRVLAAARLLQTLISMWRSDEQERTNRLYVLGQVADISILPDCWVNQILQSSK